jgi:hypothetical protein
MRYKCQLKLNRQQNLHKVCFAALLLLSLEVGIRAESSTSKTIAPDGWPERLDKRKLYSFKHAFVYSVSKSYAAEVNKRIETAVKKLEKDSTKKNTTITGLALVTDIKEKPLVDLQKIIEVLRQADKKRQSEKSKKDLKSVIEAKENIEKEGMDMDMVMSITPIPIEPNLLPEIINKFPEDVDKQIDFCVFVPTSRNIKYGFKKMIDTSIKKKKIGLAERLALIPLMPFIEGKVVDGMKKSQQLVVYERLLEKQKHLTEKQREDKVKAYKKKLGLGDDDDSDSKSGKNNTDKIKGPSDSPP